MKCPRCQAENDAGARFCEDCGARLEVTCRSCGAPATPGKKFCRSCGAALTTEPAGRFAGPESYTPRHLAERILTSRGALEGERKHVTVLFADLKGSMELLADRDPEEARRLLDPILEHMMEAVHRYEGTVNQVMGDGIMALFGAPIAHEDHAVRACYAALRMEEAVKRYAGETRRTQGVEVDIRVGLNSGEVVVRSIGSDLRMDYTAVGQTTHLAARMEQLASPGTIRLTADTLRLAEGYVQVKSLGPTPVKGLAEPVEVFELTGAGTARTRLQAAALRGLTRFVGRDAEVEHLRRVLGQAGAGCGQVVAIVGEAGVGKSRLVYEFTHTHRVQDWLILEASSVSYGKATSYLPVIDLLKGYFKIGDRDNHREMRDKVLGRVLGLDRALEPLVVPLLALLDVPVEDPAWQALDPPQRRQRTLDAVKRLLLRESQVQPLLMVVEDLHWIDSETQALLDSIVESLGSAHLLLLVNYRPEYEHRWGSKTAYSQLRLDSLPAEGAAELLAALLGPEPGLAALTQMLVKRGNPFFLEETVRTLVETGALGGERGAYRLAGPLEALQVPARVQTILAARIDRLPPEEKQLLQAASVVGKDVPYALLAAIADQPEETLRRGLAHLQEAEFLYETRLFPDLEYTFKHALTHEVAYNSLLQRVRRALHTQILGALERLHSDRLAEHVERLAHHAVRGENWRKAAEYCRESGLRAFAHGANPEAVTYFELALEAVSHLPADRATLELGIDLRIDLRHALLQLGSLAGILDHLRQAQELAQRLDDPGRAGRVLAFLAPSHFLAGQFDQAIAAGEGALNIASSLNDFALRIAANYYLGLAHYYRGTLQPAIRFLTENVELLEGQHRLDRLGMAGLPAVLSRSWLSTCFAETGQFADGVARAQEAVQLAENPGRAIDLIHAYLGVGVVHAERGDFATAIKNLELSLELSREWKIVLWVPWIEAFLGSAYARSGQMAAALPLLQHAVEDLPVGPAIWRALCLTQLGHAYLLSGRLADAFAAGQGAVRLARRNGQHGGEAEALRLLGDIGGHGRGDVAQARKDYNGALALAADLGLRPLAAHCHLGLGALYRKTGRREHAHEHLTAATTMYRDMGMRFWLEQAETALGPSQSNPP